MSGFNVSDWKRVSLGDVCSQIDYGHTASACLEPIGPKFLRITDIQNGKVDWNLVPYCLATDNEESRFKLQEGDILFARTGATTGKSFLIRKCPQRSTFASYLIRVRPNRDVVPRFLARFFETPDYWNQISKEARGAGQPGVNATSLKSLLVPLPPLSEQKRIADILDKADAIRRKRQEAVDELSNLRSSAFSKYFGDPTTNPFQLPIGTINDLVSDVTYGTSSKAGPVGKHAILRMNNITPQGDWDFTELKYIDLPEYEVDRYSVRRGDILFNRTNSKELVGKTAVFNEEYPMIYAGYLIRVRSNNLATPSYISGYLNSPHGKATLRHMCKSIIGMANINATELKKIHILIPPMKQQMEYEEFINATRRTTRIAVNAVADADNLFDSLVQRAFEGEL